MNAAAKDIESESLPAHVALCQERYENMDRRLARIEKALYWGGCTLLVTLLSIALKLWIG